MAIKPNEMRRTILRRLREELEAEVALAINLLTEWTRYLDQICSRGTEMTRVNSLPLDQPLISYGLYTFQTTTGAHMCNANNLVAVRNEGKIN